MACNEIFKNYNIEYFKSVEISNEILEKEPHEKWKIRKIPSDCFIHLRKSWNT